MHESTLKSFEPSGNVSSYTLSEHTRARLDFSRTKRSLRDDLSLTPPKVRGSNCYNPYMGSGNVGEKRSFLGKGTNNSSMTDDGTLLEVQVTESYSTTVMGVAAALNQPPRSQ